MLGSYSMTGFGFRLVVECWSLEEGGHVGWLCGCCASLGTTTLLTCSTLCVLDFDMHAPQGYLKVRRVASVASELFYTVWQQRGTGRGVGDG